jgi:hypothetical protein
LWGVAVPPFILPPIAITTATQKAQTDRSLTWWRGECKNLLCCCCSK